MKGQNCITMNHATVLEAMQLWLDDKFKDPPRATEFTQGDSYTGTFTLKLEERKVAEKEGPENSSVR